MSGTRPVIGFQVTRLATEYTSAFLPHLEKACEEFGCRLVTLAGGSLMAPYPFDYQLNSIYDYAQPGNLDALILQTGTLRNFVSEEVFAAFIRRMSTVPLVSLAVELEGIPSILTDNGAGIERLVRHLVLDHGKRRLAFIKGPERNPESQERYKAFESTLRSCGLDPLPELVCEGDFQRAGGAAAARRLVEELGAEFDAVVAANDDMALGALAEFKDLGIAVPERVAVTGFDDIPQAALGSPDLTTIAQPYAQQARLAVQWALDLVRGHPVPLRQAFPSRLVCRSSCGCLPEVASPTGKAESSARLQDQPLPGWAEEHRARLESLLGGGLASPSEAHRFLTAAHAFASHTLHTTESLASWGSWLEDSLQTLPSDPSAALLDKVAAKCRALFAEARVTLQIRAQFKLNAEVFQFQTVIEEMLSAENLEHLARILERVMAGLGVEDFYLVLHDPVDMKAGSAELSVRQGRRLHLGIHDGRRLSEGPSDLEASELIPRKEFRLEELPNLAAMALFHRETLLGHVCLASGRYSMAFYDNFILVLGSTVKHIHVIGLQRKSQKELEDALEELRKSNEKLSDLSRTDELTGLSNRRGFLETSLRGLQMAARLRKNTMLFFIDLDGLKRINDTYGHADGDLAIQAAARVLESTFRKADVLARLGGDEFVVLSLDAPESSTDLVLKRLMAAVEDYNCLGVKPWILSMSVGSREIPWDNQGTLEDRLLEADELLLEEKRRKRKDGLSRPEC